MNLMDKINEFLDMNQLNEMATVCRLSDGYQMIIIINSNDHNPPHAHVLDSNRKEIGRFKIGNKPNNINDIIEIQNDIIPIEFKKRILKWANNKTSEGTNNWKFIKDVWKMFH